MTTWKTRLLTLALLGLVAAFSIFLVNRWADGLRADLTAENLYSLSPGTTALLAKMRQEGVHPVDVKMFFSESAGKTLPRFVKDFITYERFLRNLLKEYERESGGKLHVEFLDPIPDSDLAQEATSYNLDGKVINQEGDLFYFGLGFQTQTGTKDAIEFLWPNEQESIEYEVSKKLYRLLWPERKKIGVLSGLEVFGSSDDPFMAQMMAIQGRQPSQKWIAIQLLEELYEVAKIEADAETISRDEYDLVIVVHPKDLPGKAVAALDEWVVRGGRAMVLLDAYSIVDRPPQNPQQPWAQFQYKPASNLSLLGAWGLERPEDTFAADFELAVRRPVAQFGPAESVVVDLRMTGDHWSETTDQGSPILAGLSDLRFLLAGVLRRRGESSAPPVPQTAAGAKQTPGGEADAGLTYEALVQTTSAGNSLTVRPGFGSNDELAYTDFNQPAKLRDAFSAGSQPLVLAYLVTGRFPTAFPGGYSYLVSEPETPPGLPPGAELPEPADAERITRPAVPIEDRGDGAVIVFSDVDFIADQLAFVQSPFGSLQAANDNSRLFLNAVDFLLGSRELMAVRGRKTLRRPFNLFDEIETQAERSTLDRERQIRDEIESFQDELRAKQSTITSRNAALFQKKLKDEVDQLNQRIEGANGELRQIRQGRRQAIDRQESMVRFSVMGWMPLVVMGVGLFFALRRRRSTGG